jgi:recombination protein RecA
VAEFDILYNEGISKEGGLIDLATELGLVKKSGSFYSYGEMRLGQGRENAREFLKHNSEVAQALETGIRQQTLTSSRGVQITSNGHATLEDLEADLTAESAGQSQDRDG